MKAFIIYLPDREHSVEGANQMLDTLINYGLDASLMEGTPGTQAVIQADRDKRTLYPYSIKTRELENDEIKNFIKPELWKIFTTEYNYKIFQKQSNVKDAPKMSRPGVIGCFYSHYRLWQHCVKINEPIMIFEDDVKFFRPWYPIDWEGVLILSLGKSSFMKDPFKKYLENPEGQPQAMKWTNYSLPGASGYAIKPNTAKALVKFYRNYFYPADNAINQSLCTIQIHNYIMGRNTLPDEGNISMTKAKDW